MAAAVLDIMSVQRGLQREVYGLRAQLLIRRDEAELSTLMETYELASTAMPRGLDETQMAHIDAAVAKAASAWQIGERHSEIFDTLPD